ncbi:MAG: hypothetical protein WBL53_05665, partial [Pseudonocardiaceae bacterium]
ATPQALAGRDTHALQSTTVRGLDPATIPELRPAGGTAVSCELENPVTVHLLRRDVLDVVGRSQRV